MLQINSVSDHIHIFIGMRPHQSVSALVQLFKSESTKWVNDQQLCASHFVWQHGYGAFSYFKSGVNDVIRYIQNQEIHHRKELFLTEYRKFLTAFEVDWDEQYIFKELE
jgi:putative transposase